jgi:hypothetical protein
MGNKTGWLDFLHSTHVYINNHTISLKEIIVETADLWSRCQTHLDLTKRLHLFSHHKSRYDGAQCFMTSIGIASRCVSCTSP